MEKDIAQVTAPTRIAVYDDMLSAPRIVDIEPADVISYIEQTASTTYSLSHEIGGRIPYTVIKEVCENFIHADFKEPCISILDGGNTIKFTDQGPGIPDKQRAQLPGFTSATSDMRRYIRGVGSGLPTVREYLRFSQGRLIIEDNIQEGTVVTITLDANSPAPAPVVYRENARPPETDTAASAPVDLDPRQRSILALAKDLEHIGPTDIHQNLGISISTAYRLLEKLEERQLLETDDKHKRTLTQKGAEALEGRL